MENELTKKELIVYYSNSGTAEKIALHIKKLLPDADIDRLGYKDRNYKRHTTFSALFKIPDTTPEIEGAAHAPSDYERLILVFPVWAGMPAPVMKSYLRTNKEIFNKKQYNMVCVSGGGKDDTVKWLKKHGIKVPDEKLSLKQKLIESDDYNLTSII
jgi:flavodoxin